MSLVFLYGFYMTYFGLEELNEGEENFLELELLLIARVQLKMTIFANFSQIFEFSIACMLNLCINNVVCT